MSGEGGALLNGSVMLDQLEMLRRIADAPAGVIAPPGGGDGDGELSMDRLIALLEALYVQGLIVSVRVVRARGNPQGPIAFSARLTSAGRASLSAHPAEDHSV